MPLPINYYVNITSSEAAGAVLGNRQLIPMFFDDNALIPSGGFVNFPNLGGAGAANVATYFGANSIEAARAALAFGWISKNGTAVPSISFGRYNSVACAPVIYGDPLTTTTAIASWTAITAGSIDLTMGGFTFNLTGLNFSSASTLANVATIIQTAVQAQSGGGALWTAATVTYDATRGTFELVGGATGTAVISVTAGLSGDVAAMLGWESINAIFGPGAPVQTPSQCLTAMNAINNNFGSFTFTATLTTLQIDAVALTNAGLNNLYLYSIPATAATVSAIQAGTGTIGGSTITQTTNVTQYEEQMPMMVFASTNYNVVNSTQNFMFQQFPGVAPSVTTLSAATALDNIGVNYYANTQQAGQVVNLYQRGVMNGSGNTPKAQNTYCNEIWLKSAMTSALMNLLLAINKISANALGQSQVLAICQSVISQALNNGTISVGRTLTAQQILYITNATNDPVAWQKVQNVGYWITTYISTVLIDGITNYAINYTLIYAQDDVVNEINGQDILI